MKKKISEINIAIGLAILLLITLLIISIKTCSYKPLMVKTTISEKEKAASPFPQNKVFKGTDFTAEQPSLPIIREKKKPEKLEEESTDTQYKEILLLQDLPINTAPSDQKIQSEDADEPGQTYNITPSAEDMKALKQQKGLIIN